MVSYTGLRSIESLQLTILPMDKGVEEFESLVEWINKV